MSSMNLPLKVVHMGVRAPVFPTEAVSMGRTLDVKRWTTNYLVSLLAVYITLKIWWEMVPSYPLMFYLWIITIPVFMAGWTKQEKKGLAFIIFNSGFVAWLCDIFLLSIIDNEG